MNNFSKIDTHNQVIEILANKLSIDKAKIDENSSLRDLGADSLDTVEIIMQLEEQFGIEIDDQKAEELKNVAQVVDYVNALRTK